MDGHTWATSVYVAGDWRVTDRLSVQAGLRYERAAPFVEARRQAERVPSRRAVDALPGGAGGLVYPGDPGVPRGTYQTDGNNIAPRVGVVWDLAVPARASSAAAGGCSTTRRPGRATSSRTGRWRRRSSR
jgi:outer membrane receptor protein involved in Fe transport